MKSLFEKMIGVKIPCGYGWDGEGTIRRTDCVAAICSAKRYAEAKKGEA